MLVLTRQKGQKIIVEIGGERLELTLVDVRGDKVRLGFDAPESIKVIRAELEKQVAVENKAAAALPTDAVASAPEKPIKIL